MAIPAGAAEHALELLWPTPDPYLREPARFASEVLGFHAWSKQIEIMESVRDHERTAVRACHGVGKTASAAQIALWFLAVHRNSRVITTAPTWAQVEQLLWREIRAAVTRAHVAGKGSVFPRPSATKLEIGEEWFAIGLSTNEPERFQGHHADHILLVVDEASGVDEKIYEAAEGFLTAEGAKMLLIGNPTRIGGQFYRAFNNERAAWSHIHVSVTDSPNYTGEQVPPGVARSLPRAAWAEEKAAAWGVTSPMYQVRVLGNFPRNADDVVMQLGDVEDAQARVLEVDDERAVISCDVARFGDDETTIVERHGPRVRILESYVGKPTTHTAARIMHWADRHNAKMRVIVVDDSGVGGGVTDQLRAGGYEVVAFNGGNTARRPKDYPNRRSEVWFEAAAMLEEIDLDTDEQLAADLTAPEFGYDLKQRRVVESKDVTKRRLGRSPDRADAVCMALSMAFPVIHRRPPRPVGAGRAITAGLLDEAL
jgi:hypothetical protein